MNSISGSLNDNIEVATGLQLPAAEAVSQVYAIMGRRGSGKTYAAGVLCEQLLKAGRQVVVLDPVGTWWGLRLGRDGEGQGLSVPVFGGQHGDLPLEPTAGKIVAGLVAEQRIAAVLDVSEMTGAEQRRFVGDFARELLAAKRRNRSAMLVIFEEAQEFAPQLVRPDHAQMVGAVEKLIKLGRNFGVGAALVSQRPQAVNKDVLNQAEILMAFQLSGPHERKAIDAWVQEKGADRSIIGELPGLAVGQAIIWSPQWLRIFGRYRIVQKATYDASATPGAAPGRAGTLAEIDLGAIRGAMAASIERIKAEDPALLRREIADLKRQLAAKPEQPKTVTVRVEVPVLSDEERSTLERIEAGFQRIAGIVGDMNADVALLRSQVRERLTASPPQMEMVPAGVGAAAEASTARRPAIPRSLPVRDVQGNTARRPLAERRILAVLAQYGPRTKKQIAIQTGYAIRGGGFANALGALRRDGLMETAGDGTYRLGPEASGIEAEPLPTGPAWLEFWQGQLPKCERSILAVLAANYPGQMDKEELAAAAGYEPTGGGFNNALGKVRTLELIERGMPTRLSAELAGG